jgi:hypothetical protein
MASVMEKSGPDQLLCVLCAKLHRPAELCPLHPDEPLLDPRDEQVVYELIALDDKAKQRTYIRWPVIMGAIGLAAGIATLIALDSVSPDAAEAFRLELVTGPALGMGALGLLVAKLRYRPRFTKWTKDVQ